MSGPRDAEGQAQASKCPDFHGITAYYIEDRSIEDKGNRLMTSGEVKIIKILMKGLPLTFV